ncbi:MAG: transposase [Anaerolineae bacterium]
MSALEYQIAYRRHLPHFQPPGASLFITSRLAGSIPIEIQKQLMAETERVDTILAHISDPQERAQRASLEQRRFFGRWDAALDAGKSGPFWLQEPEVAKLVAESLHYRDGRVYDLDAFCIMPNHIHLVFTPLRKEDGTYHAMSAIMHSLKGRCAREANLLLGRQGKFWQHENYDRVIRDEAEWQRVVNYVLNNPVKANLVQHWKDWPWTYSKHLV